MKLLVAVIEDTSKIETIMDLFYENDIGGATIINSRGMGHLIAHHYSIFSRFGDLTGSDSDGSDIYNNTIFTVIKNDETLQLAIKLIEEVVGDLNQPDTGLIFTLPVLDAKGFDTPLE